MDTSIEWRKMTGIADQTRCGEYNALRTFTKNCEIFDLDLITDEVVEIACVPS